MRLRWFIQTTDGRLFTDYSYNAKNGELRPGLSGKLDKAKPFDSEEEAREYARLFPQYRTFKVVELVAPLSKGVNKKKATALHVQRNLRKLRLVMLIIVVLLVTGIGIEVYAYREAQKCKSLISKLKDISPEAIIQALYAHFYGIEHESAYHAINVLSERLGVPIYIDGHLKEPAELKRLVLNALTKEELIHLKSTLNVDN